MFELVGNDTQGERLSRGEGLVTGRPIDEDTREVDDLGDPASIDFPVQLYRESHSADKDLRLCLPPVPPLSMSFAGRTFRDWAQSVTVSDCKDIR